MSVSVWVTTNLLPYAQRFGHNLANDGICPCPISVAPVMTLTVPEVIDLNDCPRTHPIYRPGLLPRHDHRSHSESFSISSSSVLSPIEFLSHGIETLPQTTRIDLKVLRGDLSWGIGISHPEIEGSIPAISARISIGIIAKVACGFHNPSSAGE